MVISKTWSISCGQMRKYDPNVFQGYVAAPRKFHLKYLIFKQLFSVRRLFSMFASGVRLCAALRVFISPVEALLIN